MDELTDELVQVVEQAKERLRQGLVPNERALEHTVILPILRALGWDSENPNEMYPDYSPESGRVDWALLKDGKPCLFLEEKAPDQNLSAHEEQLREYAAKEGVRLAILTNGREWWFYLPLEEGRWGEERKFLVIDLMTQEIDELCLQLTQFLQKDFVHGGLAYKDAKDRYEEGRERKRIREKLPEAIRALLSSPSSRVIEFFQNETQAEVATLPPADLVEQALRTVAGGLLRPEPEPEPVTGAPRPKRGRRSAGLALPPTHSQPISLVIQREAIPVSRWNEVLIETANWLIKSGYDLPVDQLAGHKRKLVSKHRAGLTHPRKLVNGFYIETNHSAPGCVRWARWLLRQLDLPEENLQVQWEERSR